MRVLHPVGGTRAEVTGGEGPRLALSGLFVEDERRHQQLRDALAERTPVGARERDELGVQRRLTLRRRQ